MLFYINFNMLLTETFVIGNEAGMYPPGSWITDKIFDNSRVMYIHRNDMFTREGYSVANGRMCFQDALVDTTVITVTFYKY